jgi:hypothetical protein
MLTLLPSLAVVSLLAATPKAASPILYAPDIVGVDRMFLVALTVPTDQPEIQVAVPDGVTMFDHTRAPFRTETRKFYFRAQRPTPRAEIRFSLPAGPLVVPVEVWSFDDLLKFRTLKNVQLPRRWPLGERLPELKQKQTWTTGAEAKRPARKSTGAWLAVSDEQIWAMQPDSTIPRWHWTNIQFGCPTHGKDIYSRGAYYPWKMDSTLPWRWKIRCPVGGEEYPSNDFGAGDMTSGPLADDGIGGGCLSDEKKYGFIAELAQFYCRRMMAVAPDCARMYVATGDRAYVHKALVAFSRLAVEYAYLATMTQHRHRNRVSQVERLGQGRFDEGPCLFGSGFTTYCIEQPVNIWALAEAYDRIFPAIDDDREVLAFLRGKGFAVRTGEDLRRFIEENLFAVAMQGLMDGACASNEPNEQQALARTAAMLNYRRGADFMDWLYDGRGRMRSFVTNGYFRDGAPFESTAGYNAAHVEYLAPVVDAIEELRRLRPDVYPESKYPPLAKSRRYHNIFDFCMDTQLIDRTCPQIGDGGGWPNYRKLTPTPWHDADPPSFEHAYRMTRDPKFAWALVHSRGWKPSPGFPLTLEQAQREAARWPDNWNQHSTLADGYGIAILRSGQGDAKRALWMMYGRARSHTQDDIMDIGLAGYQGVLLTHMGYPRNWGYWEPSWTSHFVARQMPFPTLTAQAQLMAEAGPIRVFEARAQAIVDRTEAGQGYELPADPWQRRLVALVDIDAERFYCLDFYRIAGGQEHWYAFHGQEGQFTSHGVDRVKQPRGTLAGPDVAYGDTEWLKSQGCRQGVYGLSGPMFGLAHLYNVERGTPRGPWWADWKLKSGDGLHLRLHMATSDGAEVNFCDGRSPAGGSPYEMKWIMLHKRAAAPVKSQLLSAIEPYRGQPAIRRIEPLSVFGDDEQGFPAAACRVDLGERTDWVIACASADEPQKAGELSFQGRFGMISERNGRPWAAALVGGTSIAKGEIGLRLREPEYRARIVAVDRATDTITIEPSPVNLRAIFGATVFLENSDRRIAYPVLAAEPAGRAARLRLGYDSRIGVGRSTGAADGRVKTDTPFTLQGFRYYHGARLVNADGKCEYRIVDARTGRYVILDGRRHPDVKAARLAQEFPVDSQFTIYDYGVGDKLRWPYAVSLQLREPGRWTLTSPVPAEVRLPKGDRLQEK